MLSEHEQRELRSIEQMLSSDGRFSAFFSKTRMGGNGLWAGPARLLVVASLVIIVAALLVGDGDAFMEGLGLAAVGVAWLRLLRLKAPRQRRRGAPQQR